MKTFCAAAIINRSLQLIVGFAEQRRIKVGSIKPLPSDIAIVSRKVDIKSARDIVRVKCCDREKFSLTVFRVAWSKDRRQAANALARWLALAGATALGSTAERPTPTPATNNQKTDWTDRWEILLKT